MVGDGMAVLFSQAIKLGRAGLSRTESEPHAEEIIPRVVRLEIGLPIIVVEPDGGKSLVIEGSVADLAYAVGKPLKYRHRRFERSRHTPCSFHRRWQSLPAGTPAAAVRNRFAHRIDGHARDCREPLRLFNGKRQRKINRVRLRLWQLGHLDFDFHVIVIGGEPPQDADAGGSRQTSLLQKRERAGLLSTRVVTFVGSSR